MSFESIRGHGQCFWSSMPCGIPSQEPLWRAKLDGELDYQGDFAVADGVAVIGMENAGLRALDLDNGHLRWTASTVYCNNVPDISVVAGFVFAGDCVIEAITGKLVGRFSEQSWVAGPPKAMGLALPDRYLMPVDGAERPGHFSQFDYDSGAFSPVELPVIWGTAGPDSGWIAGFAAVADGHAIARVNLEDKQTVWQQPVKGTGSIRVPDRTAVYVEYRAQIAKYDAHSGELLWHVDIAESCPPEVRQYMSFGSSSAMYTNERIYVKAFERLVVLSADDGTIVDHWDPLPFNHSIAAGDLIWGVGGITDRRIHAYDRYTAEELWVTSQNAVFNSVKTVNNLVLGADGKGFVYAFRWDEPYCSTGKAS